MAVQAQPGPAEELAGMFASLSGMLLTRQTVEAALAQITSLAVDTIAGTSGAGISLLDQSGRRITSAATEPLVAQLDDLQYELDQGPCLTAWNDQLVIRADELADETRWTAWCPRATELGMHSVLSAPLTTADRPVGAIKVYSTEVGAYDDKDEELLRRFADQAAIFVAHVQTAEAAERVSDRLKDTLHSREVIATARGMVMSQQNLDADTAYRYLISRSEQESRPLRELAERMVADPSEASLEH
jgi:GAF domain-containing protein